MSYSVNEGVGRVLLLLSKHIQQEMFIQKLSLGIDGCNFSSWEARAEQSADNVFLNSTISSRPVWATNNYVSIYKRHHRKKPSKCYVVLMDI